MSKNCKYCSVELNKQNITQKARKSCRECNITRLQQAKEDKTPQDNKICCSRCKKYKSMDEYLKQVKQCLECRSKAKKANKGDDKEDCSNSSEYTADNPYVTIEKLFTFLKTKYPNTITDNLQDIIKNILEQEEDSTEETEETDDEEL